MNDLTLSCEVRSRVDVLSFCAQVRRVADGCGLDPRQSGELLLVVAELGTNAVLHGRGGVVTVVLSHLEWEVSASDVGPGFTPAVLADAGKSDRLGAAGVRLPADGGRSFGSGLAAVRRLSSSLTLQNSSRGARAVAAKHFTKSQGAVS